MDITSSLNNAWSGAIAANGVKMCHVLTFRRGEYVGESVIAKMIDTMMNIDRIILNAHLYPEISRMSLRV